MREETLSAALRKVLQVLLCLVPWTALLVHEDFFVPFVTLKALALRMLLEVAGVVYLALALVDKRARPPKTFLFAAVFLFYASTVLSTLLSTSPAASFYGTPERMEGLLDRLHWLLFLLVLAGVVRLERRFLWTFLVALFSAGIIISVFGVFQYFDLREHVPYVLTWGPALDRVSSFLGTHATLGSFALFVSLLSLYSHFHFRSRETAGSGGEAPRFQYFFLLSAVSALLAVMLSGTRSAVVGMLAGLVAASVWIAWKGHGWRRQVAATAILTLLLGALGLWQFRAHPWLQKLPALARFAEVFHPRDSSSVRLMVWESFLASWRDRPYLGWGVEQSSAAFTPHLNPRHFSLAAEPWYDRPHNKYVELLVTQGVVGLGAFLLVLFAAARNLLRRLLPSDPPGLYTEALLVGFLAAYGVNQFFLFDFHESYLLLFTYLVLTLPAERLDPEARPQRWSRGKLAAVALALVLSVGGLWWNGKNVQAVRLMAQAGRSFDDPEAAQTYFRTAYAMTPSFREAVAQQLAVYTKWIRDPAAKEEAALEAEQYLDRAMQNNLLNMRNYVLAVENLVGLCLAKRALGQRDLARIQGKLDALLETLRTSAPNLPVLRGGALGPSMADLEACRALAVAPASRR